MTTLAGKTVFITGASSGIGAACAKRFAAAKARLLLCARRLDKLEQLANELKKEHGIECHVFLLNVSNRAEVEKTLSALPTEWQKIDILVNNAGLARGADLTQSALINDWDEMIDTNVKGLLYVTRAVLPGMVERKSGHVINIGSVSGREVYSKGAVYCATKHAVRAFTQGLHMDVLGSGVRVSLVSPGMVETEFSQVRFSGDLSKAAAVYEGIQALKPEDIADTIVYCANCPPHVNVSEIWVMPTAQASVSMTHREKASS